MSSYKIADPKVLKTLKSNGEVVDDQGNVLISNEDYWETYYNQAEPKVDKILKSDGSIVDSDGNEIQATNEFNVRKYNQAEPIPAKYLHADGTIDENPGSGGGGGSDLENNHLTTIDVSTYTEPVEIEPISGKDGMKKATVTLSNIINKLYYYGSSTTSNCIYLLSSSTPKANDIALLLDNGVLTKTKVQSFSVYGNVQVEGSLEQFRRNIDNDITLV